MNTLDTTSSKNTRKATDKKNAPESMFHEVACDFDSEGKAQNIVGVPTDVWIGWRALSSTQFTDKDHYYDWRVVQEDHKRDAKVAEIEVNRLEHDEKNSDIGKAKIAMRKLNAKFEVLADSMGCTVEELKAQLKN